MPHVKPGEKEADYISRCIRYEMHKHPDMDNKQAAAICYSLYRKHEGEELINTDSYLEEKEKRPRCSVDGCTKPAYALDKDEYPLCRKHYKEYDKKMHEGEELINKINLYLI